MLLPLPLVSFERYLLTDSRPSHPMAFTIRLLFAGRLDPEAFRRAIDRATAMHPLLHAHLEGQRSRELRWVDADGQAPYVDIAARGEPMLYPGEMGIDLWREVGIRIWVRHDDDGAEMRFQYHHSCSDGIGAYRYVEDVLCHYHADVTGENVDDVLQPIDAQLLRRRTRFGLSWWRLLLRLPIEFWGIVIGVGVFMLRRTGAVRSPQLPTLADEQRRCVLDMPAHTFTADETNRLLQIARSHGATLTDLLLREMLLATHGWNLKLAPESDPEMLRIMVPANLRGPGDELMPATNVVGMAMVDRRPGRWQNMSRLLKLIKLRMAFLKRFRLSMSFTRATALFGAVPGGMEFLTRADRCYATSVLSNMGRLFVLAKLPRQDGKLVAGELVLEGAESAPPVRPYTATAWTCLSYNGRLTIVMNYDREHLTPEAAAAHLACHVLQIEKTLADASGSAES
jgi:hypothetical protein